MYLEAVLFKRAETKIKKGCTKNTVIIVMGGICDITERISTANQTHLRNWETEIITDQIRKDIIKGLKRIKKDNWYKLDCL